MPSVAIHDWLAAEGWNEVFLDLDPESGIWPASAGSVRSTRRRRAVRRCMPVIRPEWTAITGETACARLRSRSPSRF